MGTFQINAESKTLISLLLQAKGMSFHSTAMWAHSVTRLGDL